MKLVYFPRAQWVVPRTAPVDGAWDPIYVNAEKVVAVDDDIPGTRVHLVGADNGLFVDLPLLDVVKALGGAINYPKPIEVDQ